VSTKDPHIALIDAHEKLEQIKLQVRQAVALVQVKQARGERPTEDDKLMIKAIQAAAIERAKRVQDDLYEELESHGRLS
jgi:hypothetical protein